jgi:bifunctional DNase/RNase
MVSVRLHRMVQLGDRAGWLVGLLDAEGRRLLPIRVGDGEGLHILLGLRGERLQRPLAHDLLIDVIRRLGGAVERVAIHDVHGPTFIAQLEIATPAGVLEVDCRPSDGIAVAVRARAPVVVDEQVLERAAVAAEDGAEDADGGCPR